jgi:hypothetical protein
MDQSEKDAMLVMIRCAPGLSLHLLISYLRFKRAAVQAEKNLSRSLQTNGIPKKEAKDLAASYTEWTSLRYWFNKRALPAAKGWKKNEGK